MGQSGGHCRRRAGIGCAVASLLLAVSATHAQSVEDLRDLSLDELANVNVSSVGKTDQPLGDAPATVFVITHDDIVRSGATTIPEILRLAPNLYVGQRTASQYAITARGLSGNQADQNFPNKLLVLIDGRSVYSPGYSGVYWDMQDVLPDDIERIEVISGPGATLWGANAVNGVINITTRPSGETQGLLVAADGGVRERVGGVRYGTRLGDAVTARFYARGLDERQTLTAAGNPAHDGWRRLQGGFRLDWTPADADAVTIQGDAMAGRENEAVGRDLRMFGRNLLSRWTHQQQGGGSFQVQAYYDREGQHTNDPIDFAIDTWDLYVQHNDRPDATNSLVWGGGIRLNRFDLDGKGNLLFEPARQTLLLANIFAQYGLNLAPNAELTLGIKLEKDPFTAVYPLPDVRLSWKPVQSVLLWAAASRAVRSVTPFDHDVVELGGGKRFLTGNSAFRAERLTALEAGTRIQAGRRASLSLSAFYNIYDGLKGLQITPVTFLPIYWYNSIAGHAYGLDAWGDLAVTPWWKLSAGVNLLRQSFHFKPGVSHLLGTAQVGDDPRRQARLRSSWNLGSSLSADLDLRYVGPLPDPALPSYTELGGRLSWRVNEALQLSLSGLNLLHKWHQEMPSPTANQVPRIVRVGLKWRM